MKGPWRLLFRPAVLSGLVALILTGLLYHDALSLPLFSDDLVQIPWLESVSWLELWSSPSPYGYYRPVWYSLWRIVGACTGGLRPLALHLLSLFAHFLASWLAGLLAFIWMSRDSDSQRGARGNHRAEEPRHRDAIATVVATAFFTTFPFSRQAVAWPGAVYNPLVSAMASGAVILYDHGRRRRRFAPIAWATILAVVGPFTYEAGLMVAPLLVAAEAVGWFGRRWRPRLSYSPLAAGAGAAGALIIWRAMRGASIGGFGLSPLDLLRNSGYLVQGLIYPAAPLGQQLASVAQLPSTAALWLVAIPTLAFVLPGAASGHRSSLLLGLAWFVLFALPPLISMEADWFALAPRFLYMTAGGIALIWAATSAAWYDALAGILGGRAIPRPAIVLLVTAALLAPAAGFVRRGMGLYSMAGGVIWEAAHAGAQAPPALFVNLPMRIEPAQRTYPLGFEGVTPLPQRVTAEQLVYVHTGVRGGGEAVAFGIVASDSPATYSYELHGRDVGWVEVAEATRKAETAYLTRYGSQSIHLFEAGGPAESPEPDAELQALFEDRIGLRHVSASCDAAGRVRLSATWQASGPTEADVSVFAHLADHETPNDAPLAQADGYPLLGMKPFWLFERSESVRDVRYFPPAPPGSYQIRIGLWEQASGRRWATNSGLSAGIALVSVDCP